MDEHCACPVNAFQRMISGKYKLRLIWDLRNGALRYGELQRSLGPIAPSGITARVLSRELKALAESHLIARRDFRTVPPRVEYELTDLGRSLLPLIEHMQVWGVAHLVQEAESQARSPERAHLQNASR